MSLTLCDLRSFADGKPQRVRPPKPLAASFERRRGVGTLCGFCNALGFFESHRNPALISIAMSLDHNNGGLHECTGDVLPPTSDCGEAVCCGGDGSIREGGVRRGCVPLARPSGTHRMAAIDAAREHSEWRERREGDCRCRAPQPLGSGKKENPGTNDCGGIGASLLAARGGLPSWIPRIAGSSHASNV